MKTVGHETERVREMKPITTPTKQGLYDPAYEHDACGIGFIANIKGNISREIVKQGISMLCRLEHRGGQGSDPQTGDGAGIMVQVPHYFFQQTCNDLNIPETGNYGVGMLFLPQDKEERKWFERTFEAIVQEEEQTLLGWRDVPVDASQIGQAAKKSQPFIRQVFIEKSDKSMSEQAFERILYVIRKRAESEALKRQLITCYFAS